MIRPAPGGLHGVSACEISRNRRRNSAEVRTPLPAPDNRYNLGAEGVPAVASSPPPRAADNDRTRPPLGERI